MPTPTIWVLAPVLLAKSTPSLRGLLSPAHRQKEILHLAPTTHPMKSGYGRIVRRGKENPFASEPLEVPIRIVDQIISQQNTLVPAKHIIRRRNKGEVPSQPAVLGPKGIRELHGRRGNKNLVVLDQLFKH